MVVRPGDKEEIQAQFAGWEPEVLQLLEVSGKRSMEEFRVGSNFLTRFQVPRYGDEMACQCACAIANQCSRARCNHGRRGKSIRRWSRKLISKANVMAFRQAHAMMPYQASGAGQAIEVSGWNDLRYGSRNDSQGLTNNCHTQDAYVLAGVLAHPKTTLATVPDALKAYEAVRLKHANDVHSRSRTNGQLIHFDPEAVQAAMQDWASGAIDNPEGTPTGYGSPSITTNGQIDITKLKNIGTAMFEGWKWSWTTDVQDDLSRALGALVAT